MYNQNANDELIKLYTDQELTLRQIAKKYKVSYQTIHQRLQRLGISRNTKKILTSCAFCATPIEVFVSRASKQEKHYCNKDCFAAGLEKTPYKAWKREQRVTRTVVNKYFKLSDDHVVDYLDGNNKNNDINNLAVYASEEDRIKAKQGQKVKVIWKKEV